MRPLLLLLLAGCASAPAGHWSGELTCGDEDSDGIISIDFDLSQDDDTTYSGPGNMSFAGTFELEGSWRQYEESIDYDTVTATLAEPSGAQDIHLVGEATSCTTWIDGVPAVLECNGGDDLDLTLAWDGADTISGDQGDCTGDLLRD